MLALDLLVVATMLLALAIATRQLILTWGVYRATMPPYEDGDAATARAGLHPPAGPPVASPASPDSGDACERSLPMTAVIIAAHNEERVIAGCLEAMLALSYPSEKLSIIVVNDRSRDGTAVIVDAYAARDPRIRSIHRPPDARPGKSAAIADAMGMIRAEVVVLFDADYLPAPHLLKQLVTPFADPSVGATMGRVVPINADTNMLTRLLDLERRAGYAIDQHARSIFQLVPQFGGTVGGIRMSALESVGGWTEGHLTEDTDLTFRLVLGGWRVSYLNEARCYEEVPEDWVSRFKQVRRWSYGHNDCMLTYFWQVLWSPRLGLGQRLDALLILLFYLLPALAAASTIALLVLLAYGPEDGLVCYFCTHLGPIFAVALLAPYLQVAIAASRDGQVYILRMLPMLVCSSTVSMLASTAGLAMLLKNRLLNRTMAWDKTRRFRTDAVARGNA